MLIRKPSDIRSSEITPKALYLERREFLRAASGAAVAAMGALSLPADEAWAQTGVKLPNVVQSPLSTTGEKLNAYKDITNYNNYYEFGTDKGEPARNAPKNLKTNPWTVSVEGEVAKKKVLGYDDLFTT